MGWEMGFGEAVISGFKRYVGFEGRSSRSEYWYWFLFLVIVGVVFGVIEAAVGGMNSPSGNLVYHLNQLFGLATLLPGLAVAMRRLHDTNRSGWWLLIAFTIIGVIVLIVWYCLPGTPGSNKYGDNPLGGAAAEPVAG